ncbi:MAG TPA: sigma-70 family RNA polymerase sigma factor [Pirellulales bacterium]|jgi:RNA polymerase sigma-70 factor (ECF subfamily)|nr:sigma-70 family RNA polymerase sigma factor [Pirellulales bacterium]
MAAGGDGSLMGLKAIDANELVRRAQGGCADSFAELACRFRPRLLNLLRSQVGAAHCDAEDIAQESLARAFQHLDRFDHRYRFSTWLYTIAIRLARDHARSERRRPPHIVLDEAQCRSRESEVTERAERLDTIDNLWQTARRVLNESQYTAMWLRYAEDLSPVEIARVMRKSRIGVRVLLHRGRSRLIAEISKQNTLNAAHGRQAEEGG